MFKKYIFHNYQNVINRFLIYDLNIKYPAPGKSESIQYINLPGSGVFLSIFYNDVKYKYLQIYILRYGPTIQASKRVHDINMHNYLTKKDRDL